MRGVGGGLGGGAGRRAAGRPADLRVPAPAVLAASRAGRWPRRAGTGRGRRPRRGSGRRSRAGTWPGWRRRWRWTSRSRWARCCRRWRRGGGGSGTESVTGGWRYRVAWVPVPDAGSRGAVRDVAGGGPGRARRDGRRWRAGADARALAAAGAGCGRRSAAVRAGWSWPGRDRLAAGRAATAREAAAGWCRCWRWTRAAAGHPGGAGGPGRDAGAGPGAGRRRGATRRLWVLTRGAVRGRGR